MARKKIKKVSKTKKKGVKSPSRRKIRNQERSEYFRSVADKGASRLKALRSFQDDSEDIYANYPIIGDSTAMIYSLPEYYTKAVFTSQLDFAFLGEGDAIFKKLDDKINTRMDALYNAFKKKLKDFLISFADYKEGSISDSLSLEEIEKMVINYFSDKFMNNISKDLEVELFRKTKTLMQKQSDSQKNKLTQNRGANVLFNNNLQKEITEEIKKVDKKTADSKKQIREIIMNRIGNYMQENLAPSVVDYLMGKHAVVNDKRAGATINNKKYQDLNSLVDDLVETVNDDNDKQITNIFNSMKEFSRKRMNSLLNDSSKYTSEVLVELMNHVKEVLDKAAEGNITYENVDGLRTMIKNRVENIKPTILSRYGYALEALIFSKMGKLFDGKDIGVIYTGTDEDSKKVTTDIMISFKDAKDQAVKKVGFSLKSSLDGVHSVKPINLTKSESGNAYTSFVHADLKQMVSEDTNLWRFAIANAASINKNQKRQLPAGLDLYGKLRQRMARVAVLKFTLGSLFSSEIDNEDSIEGFLNENINELPLFLMTQNGCVPMTTVIKDMQDSFMNKNNESTRGNTYYREIDKNFTTNIGSELIQQTSELSQVYYQYDDLVKMQKRDESYAYTYNPATISVGLGMLENISKTLSVQNMITLIESGYQVFSNNIDVLKNKKKK